MFCIIQPHPHLDSITLADKVEDILHVVSALVVSRCAQVSVCLTITQQSLVQVCCCCNYLSLETFLGSVCTHLYNPDTGLISEISLFINHWWWWQQVHWRHSWSGRWWWWGWWCCVWQQHSNTSHTPDPNWSLLTQHTPLTSLLTAESSGGQWRN